MEGTIVVVSADVYSGCPTCKTKITLISNKIGECKKCGSVMKLMKCQAFSTAKVMLDDSTNKVVTIFSDIITLLIQDTDADQSDNLVVKLLSIKAHKFYIHNDVVFKVVRLS